MIFGYHSFISRIFGKIYFNTYVSTPILIKSTMVTDLSFITTNSPVVLHAFMRHRLHVLGNEIRTNTGILTFFISDSSISKMSEC